MSTIASNRIVAEFAQADLGDKRLSARVSRIAERALERPDASFPDMMTDEAELEGLYRFANNDNVDLQTLLAPHFASTHALSGQNATLVVHDTTECFFSEHVEGMGFIGKKSGFLVHTALAVSADERRAPLGLLGMMPIVRPKPQTVKRNYRNKVAKESNRWRALIQRVETQASPTSKLIHVLDREGDIYALLSWVRQEKHRYVVRVGSDRRVVDDDDAYVGLLWTQLHQFKEITRRTVSVSKRDNATNARKLRVHPTREERVVELSIRAGTLRLPRPSTCPKHHAAVIEQTFVYAIEDNPPEGIEPIEWLLMTSEPVDSAEAALAVVDHYRGRWRIEEYFKALKTGCAFEKRQAESMSSLLVVLGLLAPLAWHLLAIRSLAHFAPEAPATEVLRQTQVDALVAVGRLKEGATAMQALRAIAAYGGHLKNNGAPGWLTLGRGFEKLAVLELGFVVGRQTM